MFGTVAVTFFVAGAVFGEIWVDSRSAKCCNLMRGVAEEGKVSSANVRVQSCNFMLAIMLGSWSNHPRIMVGSSAIVNDTSTVSANFFPNLECYFSWQAHCLVTLVGEICCSARCK